jgi:hypothetical protein
VRAALKKNEISKKELEARRVLIRRCMSTTMATRQPWRSIMQIDNPEEEDALEQRAEFERNSILDDQDQMQYKMENSVENKKPDYLGDLVTKIGASGLAANKIMENLGIAYNCIQLPEEEDNEF